MGKVVVGTPVGLSSVTSVVKNVSFTVVEVTVKIVAGDEEASVAPVTVIVVVDEILVDVWSTVGLSFGISLVDNVAVAVITVDASVLPVNNVGREVDTTASNVD